jgi:glycosyltransferase involved in cell wall biosynthesis
MSELVVSSYAPVLGTGRAARTFGIVSALARLGPVDLLHTDFEARDSADAPPTGVRRHEVHGSRGARRTLAFVRARIAGVPPPVARGLWPELRSAAERLAAEPGRGRVVADDPMAAVGLLDLARRRPVIYSAHNLESAFRPDWGSPKRLRAFETRLIEAAAETWLPSRMELEAAAEMVPSAALRHVPNVIDVAAIEPRRAPADPPEALFVADFTYAPNREGLELLAEVLPLVWESVPELRLTVAGRGAQPPRDGDPRVSILGFVDDLAPLYERAACAVVPLVRGGGSPVKFVEALAHGVPVVSTPRGAAGLDVVAGRDYVEGQGPEGFAEALVTALDPARGGELGAAGRALSEREHSIESLARRLAEPHD